MLLSNTAGQTYRTFSVIMIFGPLVQALVPVNRAPFYFILITRGGLMVSALVSRSSGPGSSPALKHSVVF